MKPNFILLSFTKNNFTGNMFENQLKNKRTVFSLSQIAWAETIR